MWWQGVAVFLIVIVVGVAGAVLYGAARWKSDTRDLCARMEAVRVPATSESYDPRELEGLPAPVQRYLRAVLQEGQPLISAVNMEHTGTFNMSETEEQWQPFRSTQRVIVRRPGFVWDARIRMAPGVIAHVHDAYVAGAGILTGKLFGLLPVVTMPSTPELAHGELLRFFAEMVWYPTALLPSQGVTWEAIDDTRAGATLTDGTTTVKLTFHFDAQGLIHSVHADGRYREVDGGQVLTPWQGRVGDYEVRDGMLVPLEGEVAWLLPEGVKPYWRGRIQRIQYELSNGQAV